MPYTAFKHLFDLCLLLFIFCCPPALFSQVNKTVPLLQKRDTLAADKPDPSQPKNNAAQKDLPEVIGSLFRKKPLHDTSHYIITSKPVYSIVPAIGYTLQSRFAAVLSGNVIFRTDPTAQLSTIVAHATYTQNKQFYLPVQLNIHSRGNKYKFIGDFRYYKYPQSTYGLGSASPVENENPMDYSYFRLYEVVLKKIKGNLFAGIGHIFDHHWNVLEKGTKSGAVSDFKNYNPATRTTSSGITLNASFDTRDNMINASKGLYADFQFRNNFTFLGSNTNWKSLIADVRKYFKLPRASENVLAFWWYNWLIIDGKPPYLDLPSNGWDSYSSTGRGYIQGRFRGTQMVYVEAEYRFKILANGLLGGTFFINAESFSGVQGSKLQAIQPGLGPGLRIKLNKVSKTNISLDYGFGNQNSKGLFLTVGEVF